ncbi:MAG: response regulator [Methanobacteriota archaeon]|nr:MAG: response regulator [Euryarchaeota archaeon]
MPKILVVDDEEDIRFIIKTALSKKGYHVVEAESGEECLEIVKSERPDLIFMDIMMPGIDGWETTRRIKTNPETKDIPISMVSAKGGSEDRRKSTEYAFAEAHLTKPIDFELMFRTAETLLSNLSN